MKVALNPLQWLATDDGWLDFNRGLPLPTLISEVRLWGGKTSRAANRRC